MRATSTLPFAAILAGEVVDELGRPIAGAPILVLRPEDGIPPMARRWLHERLADAVATDENGGFTIPGLLPVVHVLRVTDPAEPTLSKEQRVYVGSLTAVHLVLDRQQARAVVLRGVVRDARTNRLVPSFTVCPKLVVGKLSSWTTRSFDSGDGDFEIIGLQPGPRRIEVKAPGYQTKTLPVRKYALGTHLVDVFLTPDDGLPPR